MEFYGVVNNMKFECRHGRVVFTNILGDAFYKDSHQKIREIRCLKKIIKISIHESRNICISNSPEIVHRISICRMGKMRPGTTHLVSRVKTRRA